MEWTQLYDPANSPVVSTLVSGTPIVLLLGLLLCGASAPAAALIGLTTALLVAMLFFGMPVPAAIASAGYGGCFGLFPIGWIVLNAVFLYHLTVRSGQFEVVKRSVSAISPDRRMQALLIAFSFGTFIEGAAGFGTPVAISAALLIGLKFKPLYAAGLALIANTSPVAFGSLGTPIIMLAKVAGLEGLDQAQAEMVLSQMAGRQLPLFSLIIPAWLVAVMAGWRGVVGCWPAILVCGGSFATIQFVTANFHGPALVDVLGGVGSLVSLTVLLRFWQPKEVWRFPDENGEDSRTESHSVDSRTESHSVVNGRSKTTSYKEGRSETPSYERGRTGIASHGLTRGQIAYAWMPWVLLSVMIFLWGWPSWKETLNGGPKDAPNWLAGVSKISFEVPYLHNVVYRNEPVVELVERSDGSRRAAKAEEAVYELNWLSGTGTAIFLAAVLSAFWLRIGLRGFCYEFARTLWRVRWALFTIACMLALAFTTKYSGADATLGLAFTHTGWFYPFFAPMLGWLGVALTGSDTSANALFGSLQRITAEQLGLNPILICASNSTGGVMGKMIDAQSIVVAAVATGQSGSEGQILRFVFLHSLVLACLVGLLTLVQAYVFPWMIPTM